MSKFKQFNALKILPKEFYSADVHDLDAVANWIEENEIEGERWEFVQVVFKVMSGGGVDLLLKRKG
jgi:hypothetical protein